MNQKLLEIMNGTNFADLYKQLYCDPLTGAYNRRAFELIVKPGDVLAIIDLDSLKWINDNRGHRAGDAMLCNLADGLKSISEGVYRLSGDEFIMISPPVNELKKLQTVFSFGIGSTLDDADRNLRLDKMFRERRGRRAPRGERPPWA